MCFEMYSQEFIIPTVVIILLYSMNAIFAQKGKIDGLQFMSTNTTRSSNHSYAGVNATTGSSQLPRMLQRANNTEYVKGEELILGDCDTAQDADMFFKGRINRVAKPYQGTRAVAQYHGDQNIYCLKVFNGDHNSSSRAMAAIKLGGVGHSFVGILMKSKRGKGIIFDIELFEKILR